MPISPERARQLIELLDLIDETTATSEVLTLKSVVKRIISSDFDPVPEPHQDYCLCDDCVCGCCGERKHEGKCARKSKK